MKNWSLERWMTVLTFLAAVITFVFTLGVNYAEIASMRKDLDNHIQAENRLHETTENEFVRSSEAALQFNQLKSEVERLHSSLDRLTQTLLEQKARQ